jgi:hypothetical protein
MLMELRTGDTWMPSSTQPIRHCLAEAAWMELSIMRLGQSCLMSVAYLAAARVAMQSSLAATASRPSLSFIPQAQFGAAVRMASESYWLPAIVAPWSWPRGATLLRLLSQLSARESSASPVSQQPRSPYPRRERSFSRPHRFARSSLAATHPTTTSFMLSYLPTATPDHWLQRTRRERRGCNRCVPCAGSLSFGR